MIDHKELARALSKVLIAQGNMVFIEDDVEPGLFEITSHILYIFVDLHHYAYLDKMPKNYIVYNYQQLPFGRKHKFDVVKDKLAVRPTRHWLCASGGLRFAGLCQKIGHPVRSCQ